MSQTRHRFRDGTLVSVAKRWVVTMLPCGATVRARSRPDQVPIARDLGYGDDVDAMTRDHDLMHARLCDMLHIPSHSLRAAAGLSHDRATALAEEAAVVAVQRLVTTTRRQPMAPEPC